MTKAIDFIRRNVWQVAAGALLLLALGASKGGIAALAPLLRFLIPVGIGYLVYRAIKKKVAASIGDGLRSRLEQQFAAMNQQQGTGGRVIDLCPKCGGYAQPGHRCPSR